MKRTLTALGGLAIAGLVVSKLTAPKRFSLRDRVVLVTGGGRGLGLQIARECADRGAKIALLARSKTELDAAASELRAAGTTVAAEVCDIRSDGAVNSAIDALQGALGSIDAVFNVAGIIEVGPVDALTIKDYVDAIETNFLGAVRVVEAVREAMSARRSGRIVNISSLGGVISIPHLLPYSASKFAIRGYSEGLRAELARYGVYVTTIVPGLMRTGSPPQATYAGQPEKEYAMFEPSDSLPFTSVSVGHAARRIVDACERGTAEIVISWQAKLAVAAYALAPKAVVKFLATFTRLMPDSGGSTEHRLGSQSETPFTRSPIDALAHRATREQHEDLAPAPVAGV
jgi:short-subunit dehydrogenase